MSTNEDPHNITEIGYVVCPSSTPVPAGVVPNKTNRFTVHLARPIDTSKIRGEIEVALVEISLPHSWAITFPAKRCEYEVYVADITQPHQNPVRRRACLPTGTPVKDYGSIEELLVGLNERRPRLENIPNQIWAGKFRMSSTGKVQLCLFEGEALEMSSDLAGALGFEQTVFNFIEGKVGDAKGPFPEDGGTMQKEIAQVNVSVTVPREKPNEEFKDAIKFDYEAEELREEPAAISDTKDNKTQRQGRKRKRRSTDEEQQLPLRAEDEEKNIDAAADQAETRAIIPPGPGGRQRLKEAARYFFTAPRRGNLHYNTTNLFVYSSIVKATPVGNVSAPLLRTVHVDPRHRGRYLNYNFERPRYLPLNSSFISAIDFAIHHESGDPVKFAWGRVQCTLHFRKRRH